MASLVKTAAFSAVLAVAALVGGAGAKTDPAADAVAVPPSPPTAPAQTPPPAPPPLSGAASGASAQPEQPDAAVDEGSATETESAPRSAVATKPAEPLKRPRYAVAVIQALDKVTAETIRFEAPVGHPIRYKTLIFTVHACETTAADEAVSDAAAHVEIDSQPIGLPGKAPPPARRVFLGWMFATAPGLNLFQHPVYDAWLIACKTPLPSA